ncbi:MAG: TRAP transporter small permease [Thermodesulfobacteriota bacterium]
MSARITWYLANGEEILCAGIMTFMTLLGFGNVVCRYLGYSLAYTEELLVMLMVWLTLLGAAVGFKRRAHLGLSYFRELLPLRFQPTAELCTTGLTVITVGLVVYLCLRYHLPDEIAMRTTTSALDIPIAWYTAAIPVGGAMVMLRAIQACRRSLADLKEES